MNFVFLNKHSLIFFYLNNSKSLLFFFISFNLKNSLQIKIFYSRSLYINDIIFWNVDDKIDNIYIIFTP